MAAAGTRIDLDTAKELTYLLYSICERRGWASTGLLFNGLGSSWNDIAAASRSVAGRGAANQGVIDFDNEEQR